MNKSVQNKIEEGREKYIGQKKLQRDGRIAKIIEYRKLTDIDILLDDGIVVYHTTIERWIYGRASGQVSDKKLTMLEKMEFLKKRNSDNT